MIVAVIAVAVLMRARLARELSELPVPERRALYERTRETLRTTCMRAHGPEVAEYCRQQADFITRFRECDRRSAATSQRVSPPDRRC